MNASLRTRWTAVVVLASLYVAFNAVELAVGAGGWPQIVGLPLGLAVVAYGTARLFGWEGIDR
ncbi:MAG TPA: hypothetical protein VFT35_03085 [Gaiellaceae bacterium]|nr:hypothetical protein [Gaiellaceae bacterium]